MLLLFRCGDDNDNDEKLIAVMMNLLPYLSWCLLQAIVGASPPTEPLSIELMVVELWPSQLVPVATTGSCGNCGNNHALMLISATDGTSGRFFGL